MDVVYLTTISERIIRLVRIENWDPEVEYRMDIKIRDNTSKIKKFTKISSPINAELFNNMGSKFGILYKELLYWKAGNLTYYLQNINKGKLYILEVEFDGIDDLKDIPKFECKDVTNDIRYRMENYYRDYITREV